MRDSLPSGSKLAIALVVMWLVVCDELDAQAVTQPTLRAAFLFSIAKFTEWPPGSFPTGRLTLCVLDDRAVEVALSELVGDATIDGRTVIVPRNANGPRLRACNLLYIGEATGSRTPVILNDLLGEPVLTISNGDDFIRLGGIVGLFVEGGQMRFAINADTARRAGVRLSSRLLHLARIHKDGQHDEP